MLYNQLMSLEERKELPLNGPSNYRVHNNIIYTKAMEINATKHCNLSCRGCSHSAPSFDSCEYDLDVLKKDLSILSNFIRCDVIRIVGGEPLLHSNFDKLIDVIRDSQICNKISLITNGILLPSIDQSIFNKIDELEVSIYPLNDTVVNKIKEYVKKISNKLSKVRLLEYESFRESISKEQSNNSELIQEVYNTCQIAHFWRCITIEDGYIYRCPQSMINAIKTKNYSDGLKIDSIDDYSKLLAFLENNNPIHYCSNCLGSVGKTIKHEQVNRKDWNDSISSNYEQSIDFEYLNELSHNSRADMKCLHRHKV